MYKAFHVSPPQAPLATDSFLRKLVTKLGIFSFFLAQSQDLGLRIFPLNPENLGSALFFSLVHRVLLGLNPSAFSVCREFSPPGSRRLLTSQARVLLAGILVLIVLPL
ncbi:hypothetical protein SLEP1_g34025 [Rubroshorea leprosula]|uniref:Uncharacterized protein n=1 Tax=Rubroshorea leprosula TaxID=152421 RepID=A0AAV5KIG9_9ROSI|nr:hypothetical protein SLEP1_g34025 [Rubroshorea leprosula]